LEASLNTGDQTRSKIGLFVFFVVSHLTFLLANDVFAGL